MWVWQLQRDEKWVPVDCGVIIIKGCLYALHAHLIIIFCFGVFLAFSRNILVAKAPVFRGLFTLLYIVHGSLIQYRPGIL